MPLKIMFDANPLVTNKSGVGYYTDQLIRSLASFGSDEVELVGYYFNFGGRKRITNLPKGTNIHYKEIRFMPGKILNICRYLGFQFPLQLLIRGKADVVLSTNFVPSLVKHNSKQVVAIHDLAYIDYPDFVSAKNGSFLRTQVPKTLKHTDLVVTISSFTKERLIDVYKINEGEIYITPIPPASHVKSDKSILKRLELGNGYLLFVGTIEPRKNIIGFVEAYALLDKRIQDNFPLVLTGGKGWNDDQTLERIEALRAHGLQIIQTGYVSDAEKAALYENATMCVQPSHYEGLGMPILEAMSYNKPVACSDIDVFHELAANAAIYFDKDDPASIANALTKVIGNTKMRNHLIELGKQRLADYPNWEQVALGLLTRIQQL
jgi:glycosyltransferase involved in cell wall biosynthesis